MKKLILLMSFLAPFATVSASTSTVTSALHPTLDIPGAISLFNRIKPELEIDGPCISSQVTIKSEVMGFNPAKWTAIVSTNLTNSSDINSKRETQLTDEEIRLAISLFDRVGVPVLVNGIQLTSEAILREESCGMSPSKWTISYETELN